MEWLFPEGTPQTISYQISTDVTLLMFLTKFHLVKAMVFPVVMYEYESWTIKKAGCRELMLLNCVVGENS